MGRYASSSGGGDFLPAPAGTHRAVCIGLVDIGTQRGEYQGKPTLRNQVIIRWELSDEEMEDGKPFIVSGFYTNSLSEKSRLRPLLESWRGRAFTDEELAHFDLQSVLGKPCLLSVVHQNGKARVAGASALPKGMEKPAARNKLVCFWIDDWDGEVFESLPKSFQAMINQSVEVEKRNKGDTPSLADMEDDIPF